MTTLALSRPSFAASRLSFAGLLRSEWIKFRSLRSTFWSLVMIVGFAALISFLIVSEAMPVSDVALPLAMQHDALAQGITQSVTFSQLFAGVLGVLIVTGEYSTGMIRSTMAAAPRRLGAYAAKIIVVGVSIFVAGVIASLVSYLAVLPLLADRGIHVTPLDAVVMLAVLRASAYLALASVFAVGVGMLLRSTAGGLATVFGLLLVLPIVLMMIPAEWATNVEASLLTSLGADVLGLSSTVEAGEVLELFAKIAAWPAAAVALGGVVLARRDV